MGTLVTSALRELYNLEHVKTEFTASRLIAGWNHNYPAEFVDVPWSVIINKGFELDKIPIDPYHKAIHRYVVCQHIRWRELIPYWESIGVKHIFTPHMEQDDLDNYRCIAFPHYAPVDGSRLKYIFARKHIASFVGACYTHPTRRELINKLSDDFLILDTGAWHFEKSEDEQNKLRDEYFDILSNTVYALCPRGTGPATIRMWEAMAYGCIPVFIEDTNLPFSRITSENDTFPVVASSVDCIGDAIYALGRADVQRRSYNAMAYYYEHQGDNFINSIKYAFKTLYT